MRKTICTAACVLAMASAPALAQEGTAPDWADKTGAFGIGANTTLGGTNGLTLRYAVSQLFGLHLNINLDATGIDLDENGDSSISIFQVAVGIYATYKLAYWQRGSLAVLFGGDIANRSDTFETGGMEVDNSTTNIVLGLGLMAEWFPTQYLSLFAQAGLRIDFLDDPDTGDFGGAPVQGDVSGVGIELAGNDLLGAFGFTVWFR